MKDDKRIERKCFYTSMRVSLENIWLEMRPRSRHELVPFGGREKTRMKHEQEFRQILYVYAFWNGDVFHGLLFCNSLFCFLNVESKKEPHCDAIGRKCCSCPWSIASKLQPADVAGGAHEPTFLVQLLSFLLFAGLWSIIPVWDSMGPYVMASHHD